MSVSGWAHRTGRCRAGRDGKRQRARGLQRERRGDTKTWRPGSPIFFHCLYIGVAAVQSPRQYRRHLPATPNHHPRCVCLRLRPLLPLTPPQPTTPRTRSRPPTPSTPTPSTTPQRPPQISTGASATSNAASRSSTSAQNTSESLAAITGPRVSPPLPLPAPSSCPPVFPLIFHSISDEIPDASRPLITRLYQLWLVLLATLFINMLACIFVLAAGASDGGKDLGGSIGSALSSFPSDHLLTLRKLLVHHLSPLLPLVVQVSPPPSPPPSAHTL